MKRKRFVMNNPLPNGYGGYCFFIKADPDLVPVLSRIEGITHIRAWESESDKYTVDLDERYDCEEVWLTIYDTLAAAVEPVELGDIWKDAL